MERGHLTRRATSREATRCRPVHPHLRTRWQWWWGSLSPMQTPPPKMVPLWCETNTSHTFAPTSTRVQNHWPQIPLRTLLTLQCSWGRGVVHSWWTTPLCPLGNVWRRPADSSSCQWGLQAPEVAGVWCMRMTMRAVHVWQISALVHWCIRVLEYNSVVIV